LCWNRRRQYWRRERNRIINVYTRSNTCSNICCFRIDHIRNRVCTRNCTFRARTVCHFTGYFNQIYKYRRDNIPQSSNKHFRICDTADENPSLICPSLFSLVLVRRRFSNCVGRNENPINSNAIIPLDAIISDSRFIYNIYDICEMKYIL